MSMILARGVAAELRELETVRRRTDARQPDLLVELAAYYRVGYEDVVDVLVEGWCRYGGDGTPVASEFLALEVGALLGCTPAKACGVIADALNLRYRHEVLWDAVQRLELEAARACRAAHLCHALPVEAAAWAGRQWLAKQSGLGWTLRTWLSWVAPAPGHPPNGSSRHTCPGRVGAACLACRATRSAYRWR